MRMRSHDSTRADEQKLVTLPEPENESPTLDPAGSPLSGKEHYRSNTCLFQLEEFFFNACLQYDVYRYV